MTTELAERDTLETLARVYQEGIDKIERAYTLLDEARQNVQQVFKNDHFEVIPRNHYGSPLDAIKGVKKDWKQQAWRVIFDRSGMKKVLSMKRREELDKQLHEDGAGLPDVTPENILALIQDGMAKATDYASEAAYEVFDWLRPWSNKHKTNERWKVGQKVVITGAVETGWGMTSKHRVRYYSQKNLIALDNVFHMLDGRGPIKGYNGPLIDAIQASTTGTGETDFFEFKCFKNGNLHLKFKKQDLVDRLNYIAGERDQLGGNE